MQKAKTVKTKLAHKILFVIVLVGIVSSILIMNKPKNCSEYYRTDLGISLNDGTLNLEKADTPKTRQTGLSGRRCIPPETGMLFVFESSDLHGIWMKDMKFSIDILWLDSSKKVIHTEENVPPESYPKVYYPKNPASYVIELRAGQVTERSIKIGQQLNW